MTVIKEGYKTTEFWVTMAAGFFGILIIFGVLTPVVPLNEGGSALIIMLEKIVGALLIGLPSFGYILSRSKVKAVSSLADKISGM